MGSTISSLFNGMFSKKTAEILMVGLNSAGKTTILYKLKLGRVVTTIPTMAFNLETIEHKNFSFIIWDGLERMRKLWRHYCPNTVGVIFVVDSSDRDRVLEAHDELHHTLLEEDLTDSLVLVLANKQDLPNSMTTAELEEKLRLTSLKNGTWYIQTTCAIDGTGLREGLDWLANELAKKT